MDHKSFQSYNEMTSTEGTKSGLAYLQDIESTVALWFRKSQLQTQENTACTDQMHSGQRACGAAAHASWCSEGGQSGEGDKGASVIGSSQPGVLRASSPVGSSYSTMTTPLTSTSSLKFSGGVMGRGEKTGWEEAVCLRKGH